MKIVGIGLVILGLLLSVAPATLAQSGGLTLTSKATDSAGNFAWTDSSGNQNPVITIGATGDITITVKKGDDSPGTPHNFHVQGSGVDKKSEDVSNAGDSGTVTFTAPTAGSTLTYQCDYHSTSMHGTFTVAAAGTATSTAAGGSNGTAKKSPGVQVIGVSIALLGAALLVGRRRD